MADLDKVLGLVLADRRRKAGLSQEALAFNCGLHPTYISQLERGLKSPTVRVLCLIADALGDKPSGLLAMVERRMLKADADAKPKAASRRDRRPSE